MTGSGLCAAGKKVTLKASANKGFVFTGWVRGVRGAPALPGDSDDGGRGATALPGFDERLQKNAVEYVATTPSLVIDRSTKPTKNSATSTTITGVDDDATYYACFITSAEDKASIVSSVDGWTLEPWVSKTETHAFATNVWAGVYLEWPVAAAALSQTTVKVSGLPSGLKFTAKPVTSKVGTGKNAVTVTNVLANTIYGAPTAASKTKTDKAGNVTVTPSAVKVTVTSSGKSSQTYQIDTVFDALPAWAQGTFAGDVKCKMENGEFGEDVDESMIGTVSLTIDKKGKISGKAIDDGLTYTLAAPYYSSFEVVDGDENLVSNFLADVTASWSYKEGKKTVKTNEVVQLTVQDNGVGGVAIGGAAAWGHAALPEDDGGQGTVALPEWTAWQYNWKIDPWKDLGKKFDKQVQVYAIRKDGSFIDDDEAATVALDTNVTGRVTLKFSAKGTASVSGEFVTGYNEKKDKYTTVKATGSATLVPVDEGLFEVFIYLTPKGLPPHARCVEVPWPQE